MGKTIQEIFDSIDQEVMPMIYRIIGWSIERNKIHPLIKQYESGQNGTHLYSSNDWCWFEKLTEEQKVCVAAIVKKAIGEKEE